MPETNPEPTTRGLQTDLPAPALAMAGAGRWTDQLLGPAISLSILAAVLFQLRQLEWGKVWAMIPTSPVIWLVLAASYFTAPLADWWIFRKLWNIPVSGFVPLVKKLIGNEILLGYIGELYFYDWARRKAALAGSPFGAIKDVVILSALAGNLLALLMLAVSWPLVGELHLGHDAHTITASIGVLLLSSLLIMYFRNGLLSLPTDELWQVFTIHCLRVVATAGFAALAWHLILPGVSLGSWLLLSTLRMLLSRLPFIPNKDLAFAGMSAILIGPGTAVTEMMTMVATLILATHVILGTALMAADVIERRRGR